MRKMSRAMQLAASATAGALLLGGGFALAESGDVPADEEGEEIVEEGEEIDPGHDVIVDDDGAGNGADDGNDDGTGDDGTAGNDADVADDGDTTTDTGAGSDDGTGVDGTTSDDDVVQEEETVEIAPVDTEDDVIEEATVEEPRNHGQHVSQVARETPSGPGKGQVVSEAARSDVGKPAHAGGPGGNGGGNGKGPKG